MRLLIVSMREFSAFKATIIYVYQAIWTAAIGEVLFCVREPTNPEDKYAVAVQRSGITVRHLPKKCLKSVHYF